jgi:competence protein ComEC
MIYYLTTSFIVGIVAGRSLPLLNSYQPLFVLASAAIVIAVLFHRHRPTLVLSTCVILFFVGFWRFQSQQPRVDSRGVQSLNDQGEVILTGTVATDPEILGSKQRFAVDALQAGDARQLKGKIIVKTRRFPSYRYGDRLKLTAKLKTPPEFNDFNYREYLAAQGIYSLATYPQVKLLDRNQGNRLQAALIGLRHLLEQKIKYLFPEPEASLLAGVILGVKRSLPPDFYDALQRSGTLHVVVVSGQNVSYVVLALIGLSSLVLARGTLRILLALLGIVLYALLVGGGAAVWRATLMGMVTLLALFWGQTQTAKNALMISALILLLINPLSLWQVGFELSFAATAGLIFLQDIWGTRLQDISPFIHEGLLTTLSAQISVLPILIHNFRQLSLVAPLTNFLIFWLVPLITLLGGLTLILAFIFMPLAKISAALLYVPLRFFVETVVLSARLPFAQVKISPPPVWVWVGYYLLLAALMFFRSRGAGRAG